MIQGRPTPSKTMFTIIWFAMLVACIIYHFVGNMISPHYDVTTDPPIVMQNYLTILAIISFIVGAYFLWGRTAPINNEKPNDYILRAQTSFLTGIASFEAIAIFGLTLRLVGPTDVHIWFIAAAFVLLLIAGTRIRPIFSYYNNLKDMEDTASIELWE